MKGKIVKELSNIWFVKWEINKENKIRNLLLENIEKERQKGALLKGPFEQETNKKRKKKRGINRK